MACGVLAGGADSSDRDHGLTQGVSYGYDPLWHIPRWDKQAVAPLAGRSLATNSAGTSRHFARLATWLRRQGAATSSPAEICRSGDGASTAQALACALLPLGLPGRSGELGVEKLAEWLVRNAAPSASRALQQGLRLWHETSGEQRSWLRTTLRDLWAAVDADVPNAAPWDCLRDVYEEFLRQYEGRRRALRGVYYTPRPVARYIVAGIDRLLREEMELADGLADLARWRDVRQVHAQLRPPAGVSEDEPFVRLLDPAMGTGVFWLETADLIHARLMARWQRRRLPTSEMHRRWTDYVAQHLMTRLYGLELSLPPLVLAHWKAALYLRHTGFLFDRDAPLNMFQADTLAGARRSNWLPGLEPSHDGFEADSAAEHVRQRMCFTVLLGNPPFRGISANGNGWMDRLLKGDVGTGSKLANYYQVDGRPLGERKTWLQDDYVKFLRYAHWKIENAGCGIIGMVTSHGYLDAPTFRGMRQQLLATFPRIRILDLHGNRKKHERSPDGSPDENVFSIEQGVAIGLFCRPAVSARPPSVAHDELWGPRQSKLERLARAAAELENAAADSQPSQTAQPLQPGSPQYYLTAPAGELCGAYEQGWSLSDVMPVRVTAPVTARDSLVVAFKEEELLERLNQLADPAVPDELVRKTFFPRARSTRYAPGDTRGWKLSDARRRLATELDWRRHITSCLYRPFDRRAIFWVPWMIDWPRDEVMRHMREGRNLALIARRQMLPTQECSFFWITDRIMLDGVIRSDNRGSESLFPLYLHDGDRGGRAQPELERRVNLAPGFLRALSAATGLHWAGMGRSEPADSSCFRAEDVLHYCYALFHWPDYRSRFAVALRRDYPRVLIPCTARLFTSLRDAGRRLAAWHLHEPQPRQEDYQWAGTDAVCLPASFPRYESGAIRLTAELQLRDVEESTWNYRVGGHQVCRKWLKDRRGRALAPTELAGYRRIVFAVQDTIREMSRIQTVVAQYGGWPGAFVREQDGET